MSDDDLNQFHTFLDETPRLELQYAERERLEIEAYIGRYIVKWNLVDYFLAQTIAHRLETHGRPGLDRFFGRMNTREKIELLGSLLPSGWRDGRLLVTHLGTEIKRRNELAHWNLAMAGRDEDGTEYGWHLWSPKGSNMALTLKDEDRSYRLMTVRVLLEAVTLLLSDDYLGEADDMNAKPLAKAITDRRGVWRTRDEHRFFVDRANELFPRSSAEPGLV